MNKKILLVVPSLSIGGQEKAVVDTAKLLGDEFDVKIVLFHKHDIEYPTDCSKLYLNVNASQRRIGKITGQIRRIFKLIAIRIKEKPDIVYSFGATANISNVASGLFSRGKSIISIHSYASVYKSIINNFIFRYADHIICISQEMQRELCELYPNISNNTLIENGYNIEAIQENTSMKAALCDSDIKFIAMGRLEAVKGYERLLYAFSETIKVLPGARLIFLGTGSLEEELKSLCKTLEIEPYVMFAGFQSNPFAYLSKADVFVMSSYDYEGFPNALVEALACGLACICVDCLSGPREILMKTYEKNPICGVKEAEYGILTEQSQDNQIVAKYLTEAMIRIGTEPKLLENYRSKAAGRANDFSGTVHRKKLLNLFDTM
ncbi:MAG: glycosyltransferase [Clostridia bacterium]|nr:glycosyltransferase [Clostridia bacterium]